jgi:hypothetical protein
MFLKSHPAYTMTQQNDIVQEISNMAPILGEMKLSLTVPEVPEGYFEQDLPGAIWSKIQQLESIQANEEIQQLSPLLAGIKGETTPISAPESYFKELSAHILQERSPVNTFAVHRNDEYIRPNILRLFAGVAAAASILLVVSLAVKFSDSPGQVYPAPAEYSMADITAEDIINYLSEDPEDLDIRLIAQELNIQPPAEQPLQITTDDFSAINAYLEENIDALDESMIAEELL